MYGTTITNMTYNMPAAHISTSQLVSYGLYNDRSIRHQEVYSNRVTSGIQLFSNAANLINLIKLNASLISIPARRFFASLRNVIIDKYSFPGDFHKSMFSKSILTKGGAS